MPEAIHFFSVSYSAPSLYSAPGSYVSDRVPFPKSTLFCVNFSGREVEVQNLDATFGYDEQQHEEFMAIATKFGDINYSGYSIGRALGSSAQTITIKALTDYNDTYRAGSDLSSIVEAVIPSYLPYFQSEYTDYHHSIPSGRHYLTPEYASTFYIDLDNFNPIGAISTANRSMYFNFKEEATFENPQFELSITFDNGTTLTGRVDSRGQALI